jgi:hypothetical protein
MSQRIRKIIISSQSINQNAASPPVSCRVDESQLPLPTESGDMTLFFTILYNQRRSSY